MSELSTIEAIDLGGTRLVRVSGEIDLSNARTLLGAIGDAVPGTAGVVAVDLGGVTYLDSSGIAMLFRLAERLVDRRQELRLVVPADAPVRRVLELTNLPALIHVQDALDELPDRT